MGAKISKGMIALLPLLLAGSAVAVVGILVVTNGEIDPLGMVARSPIPAPSHVGPLAAPTGSAERDPARRA